jgi:2-polyprenyl-6-methoxyphenol hydroxylase-like FAD-dependent oxidoreductase
MKGSVEQDRVLIVGANVAGLTLAADLLRHGVQPLIIDQRNSRLPAGAPLSLHPVSLELFAQLGLLDSLVDKGLACGGLTVQLEGKVLAVASFAEAAAFYPFHLTIDRHVVEEHLIQYLARHVCPVYWDTSIRRFRQDEHHIQLETEGSRLQGARRFAWLAVADGAQFDVRANLHVQYHRAVKEFPFFRMTTQTGEIDNRSQHLIVNRRGLLFSAPADNRGGYHFLCSYRGGDPAGQSFESLKRQLDEVLGFSVPVRTSGAADTGTTGVALASAFRDQRCILLGDAACPSGLAGDWLVNQGIADARAIGWRLAYVLKGLQDVSVLESIDPERRNAASALLGRLEQGLQLATLYRALPYALTRMLLKRWVAGMKGHRSHLRTSPLSLHHARGKGLRAGDRLPFMPLYDEKKEEMTDLHQCCSKTGFVLLMLGTLNKNSLFVMSQWAQQKYAPHMRLFYLPFSIRNQAIFDAFEVPEGGVKMVLVRPDRYIAYMHDTVGANLVDSYMQTVMKWRF